MGEVALMAIELPAAQKVYTTKYDNFRGVDFTNDSTNIWRRRSPTGVNMLPDASGRPFKRHGWDILITNEELSSFLGVTSCTILKCSYFELAGVDHIVIFTDTGVAFYNGSFTAYSKEYDCYTGYDRSFFFEGDGTSAFYIYGNFRVWKYYYDGSYQFAEVTNDLTIPRVVVGASADGTGTVYEGYNLLGVTASVEYNNRDLFTYWCSDGLNIIVPSDFTTGKTLGTVYRYTWDESTTTWVDTNSTGVSFASTDITVKGTPENDDEIILVYATGVLLPNNVTDKDKVSVFASASSQFDTSLEVIDTGTPTAGQCLLHSDNTNNRENGRAWIEFSTADTSGTTEWIKEIVSGEDFIKVNFPSISIESTSYTVQDNGNASLIVEVA